MASTPASPSHLPPVLLVPGAMSGAWIWADNFAGYFAAAGHTVHTMQFRGHDAAFSLRQRASFEDYVEDCVNAIAMCASPPLVIAHSMGGLIAQHAAVRQPVAAMALLSPVPNDGMLRSMWSLSRQSPVSLAKFMMAAMESRVTRYGAPPLGVYSDTCDGARADAITRQLRSEAIPVLLRLLRPPRLQTELLDSDSLLFIGATGDHIIPAAEVARTAEALGSPCHIYSGMSHTYQAERAWLDVAERVAQHFADSAQSGALRLTG